MSIYPAWLFLRVLDMILEAFYDDLIFRGDARMNPFSEKNKKVAISISWTGRSDGKYSQNLCGRMDYQL